MISSKSKNTSLWGTVILFACSNGYPGEYSDLTISCKTQLLSNQELCSGNDYSLLEVKGATLISTPILKEIVSRCSDENQEISALLAKQKINELYACAGYVNSGALIKKNSQGAFYLDVIEGTISKENIVVPNVNHKIKQHIVRSLMDRESIKPLNINDIRGRLEQLEKSNVFKSLNTTVTPIPNAIGQAKIHVTTTSANPYNWTISLNNQQSESTGKNQLLYSGSKQGAFSLFDTIGASISISEGSQGFGIFYYSAPSQKTSWDLALEKKRAKIITKPLDKLDIANEFEKFTLGFNHQLYSTLTTHNKTNNSEKLKWQSKLELIRTNNYLLNRGFSFSAGEDEGETKITSLQTSLAWEKKFRSNSLNFATSASLGVDLGLEALGSTESSANSSGSDYKILKATFGHKRSISEHGNFLININSQFSNDQLLSAKRIGLGGAGSVRGVDKNITSFDSGITLSAETTMLLPRLSGTPFAVGSTVDGNFYTSIFADYTLGKENRTNEEFGLGSLGFGVTWHPTKHSTLDISWGKPISFTGFTADQIDQIDDGKIDFRFTLSGSK